MPFARPLLAASITLFAGCITAPRAGVYRLSTPADISAFMGHMKEDVVAPAAFVGAGAAVFWVANKNWPGSLEDIRDGSEQWNVAMQKVSEVTFVATSDRALTVTGLILAPEPFRFTATVIMKEAPTSEVGWKPEIEVHLTSKEPNQSQATSGLRPAAAI